MNCRSLQVARSRWGLLLVVVTLAILVDTVAELSGLLQPLNTTLTTEAYSLERPWLDTPMIALTYLGSGPGLAAVALAVALWAAARGRRRDALLLVATAAVAQITVALAKLAVHAPRPYLQQPPYPLTILYDYGYPSGHALTSAATLGFCAVVAWSLVDRRIVRLLIAVVAVILVAGIGLSRIYLGFHWVNDVIGGYLYGTLILLVAYLLYRCGRPEARD